MDEFCTSVTPLRSTTVGVTMTIPFAVPLSEKPAFRLVKNWLTSIIFTLLLVPTFYVYPNFPVSEVGFKVLMRALLMTTLAILALRGGMSRDFRLGAHVIWLWLFSAIAIFSILYSSDSQFTAMRALDLFCFVLLASLLSARLGNFSSAVSFVELTLYLYLLGFLFVAQGLDGSIMRPMGEDAISRLGGFIINPNLFAYCCLFLIYISLYRRPERGKTMTTCLILGLLLLIYLTYSRSAIFVLATSIFLVRNRLKSQQIAKYFLFFLALPAFPITFDYIISFLERGHGIENLMSLGGRTLFWSSLVTDAQFGANILYGFGYQMMSDRGLFAQANGLQVAMAHNNLIQSLLGLGLIGFIMNLFFWVTLYRFIVRYRRRMEHRSYALIIHICHATLIYSMVEYGIFGPSTIIGPLFFILIFAHSREVASTRSNQHLRCNSQLKDIRSAYAL